MIYKLNEQNNQRFFLSVKFLNLYHLHNENQLNKNYQQVMDFYGSLIDKIQDRYKKIFVENWSFEIINPLEILGQIPKDIEIINYFNHLPKYEQNNVINLAWFILYCQMYKPENHSVWKRYTELIEKINKLG